MTTRKYGWKKDAPDARDWKFCALVAPESLPESVDLRPKCPPVLDQKSLGSCTAHALANAHLFCQINQPGGVDALPSRLAIYYAERVIEGSVSEDAGAQIRDGIKALATDGICPESLWPYDVSRFAEQPPQLALATESHHKILSYRSVNPDVISVKQALAEGRPVPFGFTVFSSFESAEVAQTGVVPFPDIDSEEALGGHAVLAVGYDNAKAALLVMNSWGSEWGEAGYFWLPFQYLTTPGMANDFWTIQTVLEDSK